MGKRVFVQHKWLDVVLAILIFPEMLYLLYFFSLPPYFFLSNKDLSSTFVVYLTFAFSLQFVCNFIFKNVGLWVSHHILCSEPFNDPLSKNYTMQKYLSQAYQLVIHIISTVIEFKLIKKYNYFSDRTTLFHLRDEHDYTPRDIQLCFMFLICLWIVQAVYLIFIDARKKDYYELYIHHIVTMCLNYIAITRFWEYGLEVLCVHDVSDIFIDVLKILNLLHFEGAQTFFILEIVYVLTAFIWAYCRFYHLTRIIKGIFIDAFAIYNITTFDVQSILQVFKDEPFASIALVSLGILLCLHVYWFILLVRLGIRGIVGNNLHAVAKDGYEGVSDEEELKNTTETSPLTPEELEKKKNN